MIQRVQTVFLLLVAALAVAILTLPVFTIKTDSAASIEVIYSVRSNPWVALVVALSGIIALISIFLYGNRQRQMMLCRLNILFIIGAIGLILQASDTSLLAVGQHKSVAYSYVVYFPLLQIILDLLAIRFIKKDDELVRSANRLR